MANVIGSDTQNKIKVSNSKAKYYADLAEGYRDEAQAYAQTAQVASTSASSSATSAYNSAGSALVSATNAYNYMLTTQAAATAASSVIADLTEIETVADNISSVTVVAGNTSNINTVASSMTNINAVAADLTNIDNAITYANNAGSYATAAGTSATLASEWATKMDGPVDGVDYSAKYYAGQAASGQVQANWNETDTDSKAYIQNKPTIGDGAIVIQSGATPVGTITANQTFGSTITVPQTTVTSSYSASGTDAINGTGVASALTSYQLITQPMTVLEYYSGTVYPADNTAYRLSMASNIYSTVTFSLPAITDLNKLHQIFVEVNVLSAVTVNLGTTYFFNSTAPDLSQAGQYNLYFEYDNIAEHWVVGCLPKGAAS